MLTFPLSVVVRVQMLAELEEIISYKINSDQADRQKTTRKTWMERSVSNP
jgi:serine/threonine-protein kinase mTOR